MAKQQDQKQNGNNTNRNQTNQTQKNGQGQQQGQGQKNMSSDMSSSSNPGRRTEGDAFPSSVSSTNRSSSSDQLSDDVAEGRSQDFDRDRDIEDRDERTSSGRGSQTSRGTNRDLDIE